MVARIVTAALWMTCFCAAQGVPAAPAQTPATGAAQAHQPILAEWSAIPKLSGNAVQGSIVITNGTDDAFDQTVLVEAVNAIGKAFTLGYQHFTLPAHSRSKPIPFTTTLPPGSYQVRADAVAEVPSRHAIYRQHLLAPVGFVISTL